MRKPEVFMCFCTNLETVLSSLDLVFTRVHVDLVNSFQKHIHHVQICNGTK